MPWGILILPLLGGYWFSIIFYPTKSLVEQYDGERLIFFAATFGFLSLAFSRPIALGLAEVFPALVNLKSILFNLPYAGTAIISAFLGPIIALMLNRTLKLSLGEDWRSRIYLNIVRNHGDELEILLHHAQAESKSVMLTLKSGKVYVGIVTAAPADLSERKNYIRITPQKSGTRNPDTKKVQLPVDYENAIEGFIFPQEKEIPSELDKVIHKDEIEICSLYDENIWNRFQSNNPISPESN